VGSKLIIGFFMFVVSTKIDIDSETNFYA